MSRIRIITMVFILLFCLGIQFPLHTRILSQRKKEGFIDRMVYKPADIINMTVLSGFKGIAADLLWIRIDDYSHAGQMYKILPLFEMVTYLQPHFILAWSVGGWHMSFNLYHHAHTKEDKNRWLQAGIAFLKRGIKYNHDNYRLYFDVAWIYFMKTDEYNKCIEYFALASEQNHPQWVEHMLAHSYEKNGQLKDALAVWQRIDQRGSDPGLQTVVDRFITKLSHEIEQNQKNEI
ncbi:tetratricopeptide repeat protein [Chlamydiota bacterium]